MAGPRIVVAMSGGVDSSVAAALAAGPGLRRRRRVDAARRRRPRPSRQGRAAARSRTSATRASRRRPSRHSVLRLEPAGRVSRRASPRVFTAEYLRGRTPNPCVLCNRGPQVRRALAAAATLGAELVATARHYARVDRTTRRSRRRPLCARSRRGQRTSRYFLFSLTQDGARADALPARRAHQRPRCAPMRVGSVCRSPRSRRARRSASSPTATTPAASSATPTLTGSAPGSDRRRGRDARSRPTAACTASPSASAAASASADGVARWVTARSTARPAPSTSAARARSRAAASSPSGCSWAGAPRPRRRRSASASASVIATRRSPARLRKSATIASKRGSTSRRAPSRPGRRPSSTRGDEVAGRRLDRGGSVTRADASIRSKSGSRYDFRDHDLLETALTHRSFSATRGARNNEKLEFLGDAVLELAVSDVLDEALAAAPRRRALEAPRLAGERARARREGRGTRPRRAGLKLGKGEEKIGGRNKESILAAALRGADRARSTSIAASSRRASVVAPVRGRHVQLAEPERRRGLQDAAPGDHPEALQGDADLHARHARRGPDHAKHFVSQISVGTAGHLGRGESRSRERGAGGGHGGVWKRCAWTQAVVPRRASVSETGRTHERWRRRVRERSSGTGGQR